MFGRGAAFEPCGAELPPSGVVAETDGEILFAADRVTHLAAISPGDGRVYASPREIADQCRMDLFAVGEDSKAERFRSACLCDWSERDTSVRVRLLRAFRRPRPRHNPPYGAQGR